MRRSSKRLSCHGLIHWAFGDLCQERYHDKRADWSHENAPREMLPGDSQELAKSKSHPSHVRGSKMWTRVSLECDKRSLCIAGLRLTQLNANTSMENATGGRETVVWMVKTGYLANRVVTVDGGMLPPSPIFTLSRYDG
jgi:hypothetical protein